MSKSSFQENFQRQESEKLQHDDNAYHYFVIGLLTTVLFPLTYKVIVEPMLYGEMVIRTDSQIKSCTCKICTERI